MVDPIDNFYKLHTWYSFTLNPIDKHQFFGKVDRYMKFRNFVYENLFILANYEAFIELSEPRGFSIQGYSGPRLHIHGKLKFDTKSELAKFLLLSFYSLTRWTSVDIDTIDDSDWWYKYCTKQRIFKNNRLSSFDLPVAR